MTRRGWRMLGLWFLGLAVIATINALTVTVLLGVTSAPVVVFESSVIGGLYSLLLPPVRVVDW